MNVRLRSVLLALLAALLAAPAFADLPPKPATTQSSRPGNFIQRLQRQKKKQLADLMQKSIKLMEQKKYDEAEKALTAALAIEPQNETNLYNMACLKALTHHSDDAFKYLEKAATAGFTDFIKIEQDEDLSSLHKDAHWAAFLARKGEFQHMAAEKAVAKLKDEFGSGYLYEIDDQDKLIFATNIDKTTLDELKHNLLRQAHSQWDLLFSHKPDQYISVVVPSHRDYLKIVPIPGVEGFYNHEQRTLIAHGIGFVTTHEFTHALHAADLDPLGQEQPIWFVEGLATMFEAAEWKKQPDGSEPLTIHDNSRTAELQRAGRTKHLIPLKELFKMEQREFVGERAMLCYAESGNIVFYLYETQLLRKFYDTFKETYSQDKTGQLALERATGKSLDEFEKEWTAWMLKRKAPSMVKRTDGPYLGIIFGSANDGMLVRTLPRGPAKRAGFKVGDVIIGMDSLETRDETTFLPALASHHPGDTVVFHVKRAGKYIELAMVLGANNDPNAGGAATKPVSLAH